MKVAQKLAYGAGGFGTAVAGSMFLFFFSFYLTDQLGLAPLSVTVIQLFRNGWDAVNDPLVGALTDRTRSRWGRRKPYIVIAFIPFGLFFGLLWQVPPTQAPWATTVWLIALLFAYDTAASMVSVPYLALTPELTADYDERTALNGYRQAFSMLGGLLVGGAAEYLVSRQPTPAQGWGVTGWVFAALSSLPFIAVLLGVKENPATSMAAPPSVGIFQLFARTLKNRAFRIAVSIYLLSWVAVGITSTMFVYFLTHVMNMGGQVFIALLAVQLAALASIPAVVWLSDRVGKRNAYLVGISFWVMVQLAMFFVPAGNTTLVVLLAACAGVGVGTAHVMPWAMVPDCIDVDAYETNERREGAYFGVMSFLEKVGTAFALSGVGLVLHLFGYQGDVGEKSESAICAMRWLMGPGPAVILLLSMVVAWFYPLSRARHAQLRGLV